MAFPDRITGQAADADAGTTANHGTGARPQLGARKSTFRSEFHSEGHVPNAKKPLRRPAPDTLRDRFGRLNAAQSVLPQYAGPYGVGMMDIEVPAREPRIFSHEIRREHRHLLRLETVLFSVYYPTLNTSRDAEPSGRKKWSRETWLPRPRAHTARGYGRFAGLGALPPGGRVGQQWERLAVPFFAATTMWTKIPALRNADLARGWPGSAKSEHDKGSSATEDTLREDDDKVLKFPVFIFTHGLGGSRTAYSSLCGEYASYGFVVIAMEHRDGSGPRTYINHPKNVEYDHASDELKRLIDDHPEAERRKGYHKVDYIFPENNPFDTKPTNKLGVDQKLRTAQMGLRLCEIEEAYHVLGLINQGKGDSIAKVNLRRKGYKASSSRGVSGVNWSLWRDALRLDDITILGHSFGGATTVELLRNHRRFPYVRQGIIYDIWGAATRSPDDAEEEHLRKPILALNSEAFTYWPSNFATIDGLVEEARSEPDPAPSFLLTVRGSIHVSQSDFSLVYPRLCTLLLKMTVDPQRALDINVSATLEFLVRIDAGIRAVVERTASGRDRESFLFGDLIEHMPSNLKPKRDADMAIRLHKPKRKLEERVVPKTVRRWRLSRQRKGRGRDGREEGWRASDEMWVHSKSELEDIEQWLGLLGSRRERESVGASSTEREPVETMNSALVEH